MAQQLSDRSTVFLVEDDIAVRESLIMLFEQAGMRVEAFESAVAFLAQYDPRRRGCLVLDVHLPGMSGVELHEQLAATGTCIPTIFLTGHAPPEVSEETKRRGIVAVFEKPCAPEDLIKAIEGVIGNS